MQRKERVNRLIKANPLPLSWGSSNGVDWKILAIISASFQFNFGNLLEKYNIDAKFLPSSEQSFSTVEAEVEFLKKWDALFLELIKKCTDKEVTDYIRQKLETYTKIVQQNPQLADHLLQKMNLCFSRVTKLIHHQYESNPSKKRVHINKMIYERIFDFISDQNSQLIKYISYLAPEDKYNKIVENCDLQLAFENLLEKSCSVNMLGEGTRLIIANRFYYKWQAIAKIFDIQIKKRDTCTILNKNKELRLMLKDYYSKHDLPNDPLMQFVITAEFCYFYNSGMVAFFKNDYVSLHFNFLHMYRLIKNLKDLNVNQYEVVLEMWHVIINYLVSVDCQKELLLYSDIGRSLLDLQEKQLGSNPKLSRYQVTLDRIEKSIWDSKVETLSLNYKVVNNFPSAITIAFSSLEQAQSYCTTCKQLGIAANLNNEGVTLSAFRKLTKNQLEKISNQYQVNMHNISMGLAQSTSGSTYDSVVSKAGTSVSYKSAVKDQSLSKSSLFNKSNKSVEEVVVWKGKRWPSYNPHSKKNTVYKLHASFLKNSFYVHISPALETELRKQGMGQEFDALKRCVEKGKIWKGKGSGILLKNKKIKVKDSTKDIRFFGEEVAVMEKDSKLKHLFLISSYKKHNQKNITVCK